MRTAFAFGVAGAVFAAALVVAAPAVLLLVQLVVIGFVVLFLLALTAMLVLPRAGSSE